MPSMNYDDLFHIGIIVPDMAQGMAEIAKRFGVTFPRPPGTSEVIVRTAAGEAKVGVQAVYTAEGPPYLELIEGVAGTVWEAGEGSRIHHLGAFVDDIEDEVQRLTAEGAELEATLDIRGGLLAVSYVNSALGVRQELLPATMREGMMANLQAEAP